MALLALAGLLTTLLHTLVCILHCHLAALLITPVPTPVTSITPDGIRIFICHMPGSTAVPSAPPEPIDPGLLRTLSQLAPPAAVAGAAVPALVALLWLVCVPRKRLAWHAPEPPPPRAAGYCRYQQAHTVGLYDILQIEEVLCISRYITPASSRPLHSSC